ncbi:MAG: GNAT family N-acetyltransferase [Oscillospiraceae bacterium]|nr:GNAT family N-acetyltransferase [Oscillospiraceae bacterium]
MNIRLAEPSDAEEIAEIYRSLIGMPGCTWDETYPTIDFVRRDIGLNSLYKVMDGGRIAGCAYLGDFEEMERPECFDKSVRKLGEFSRVAVRREYHRRGIARELLEYLIKEAPKRGYDGLALLVGTENHNAMALYEKLGFKRCGSGSLYETDWHFYELKL